MADFRNIHTHIWKDSWFCELKPEEKLLFIYLFSNERASVCGMYELPLRYIAYETGISEDRVSAILNTFSCVGKAHYENNIVWVVNLRKYNDAGGSSKVAARATKDLDLIPDCDLKRRYYKYENIPYPQSRIPYPQNVSDTDTDTEDTDTSARTLSPKDEFLSKMDVWIGCPVGSHSDVDTADVMIEEFSLERVKRAAAWAKEKHIQPMPTALRSMNTALRDGGFHEEKRNGNGGGQPKKSYRRGVAENV